MTAKVGDGIAKSRYATSRRIETMGIPETMIIVSGGIAKCVLIGPIPDFRSKIKEIEGSRLVERQRRAHVLIR